MSKKKVYLVTVQGVEWNDPVCVYASKRKAKKRAKRINDSLYEDFDGGKSRLITEAAIVTPLRYIR